MKSIRFSTHAREPVALEMYCLSVNSRDSLRFSKHPSTRFINNETKTNMDCTLSPLTARSDAALNKIISPPSRARMDFKSAPSFPKTTPKRVTESFMTNDPPSSPFEVITDQENLPPQLQSDPVRSPSRSRRIRSSVQDFVIHEDDLNLGQATPTKPDSIPKQSQDLPALEPKLSPVQKELSQHEPSQFDFTLDLDDITATMPAEGDIHEELDLDCDARSVASEDTSFSAFSAIPNVDMTLFSNLHTRSPPRKHLQDRTPGTSQRHRDAALGRNTSPNHRQYQPSIRDGDTTNLLLDFTQQFENVPRSLIKSPTRKQSPQKPSNDTNLLSYINGQRMPSPKKPMPSTPRQSLLNLLDFDLPPQPTPRSVPSIIIRELESLKSSYLSEISSLKASLSGREAEVESLKRAVGDAERRVGEALEQIREECSAREHAEQEKIEWEKKGKEVESVLMSVKEEFLNADREREDLLGKLDESNRLKEEAELRAIEAATKSSAPQTSPIGNIDSAVSTDALVARLVANQLDEKMENLARELHTVYKKKHETKVATLKQTYEVRSEKKCHELQRKIDDLVKQNEPVRDNTAAGIVPMGMTSTNTHDLRHLEEQRAEIHKHLANIARLTEEMRSMRDTHAQLTLDLEAERIEKGELVAAVDEMLALQSEVGAPTALEDFRKSIRRPAEPRVHPPLESKIGRFGLAAPTRVPSGGKSRMMTNIERMGGRVQE